MVAKRSRARAMAMVLCLAGMLVVGAGTLRAQPGMVRTAPPTAEETEAVLARLRAGPPAVAHHSVTSHVPVAFRTHRPCSYRVEVAHFRAPCPTDSLARLLAMLDVEAHARGTAPPAERCPGDSAHRDQYWVETDDAGEPVQLRLSPSEGQATILSGRLEWGPYDVGAAAIAVRRLLGGVLATDSLIGDCEPCDSARFARPGPKTPARFGQYVYVEEFPELVERVPPEYPDPARAADVSGQVMVQALVGKDGRVRETVLLNSIPMLDAAAAHAVERWRFKPATSNGKPVAVWVAVPIKFTLH